jgi:hypothetical protein
MKHLTFDDAWARRSQRRVAKGLRVARRVFDAAGRMRSERDIAFNGDCACNKRYWRGTGLGTGDQTVVAQQATAGHLVDGRRCRLRRAVTLRAAIRAYHRIGDVQKGH